MTFVCSLLAVCLFVCFSYSGVSQETDGCFKDKNGPNKKKASPRLLSPWKEWAGMLLNVEHMICFKNPLMAVGFATSTYMDQ